MATLGGPNTSTKKNQNQTDPINQLHRAHQTAIFRLRTHHAPLYAHLHRIKKEHPAKCVHCPDSDETIYHFLFHCPLYDNIRTRLLPAQPKYSIMCFRLRPHNDLLVPIPNRFLLEESKHTEITV